MTDGPVLKNKGTLADEAMHTIRAELLSGRWPAGARIAVEETAEWLGISPSPVREALRTLSSEGLVVMLPQRGFRVPAISVEDLEDTYRLRVLLDPLATRLAAARFTPRHAKAVQRALEELKAAYATEDWKAIDIAHRRFHFGIYDVAESAWLTRFISMLWDNSQRYQHLSLPLRGSLVDRATAHQRILDACAANDEQLAAERMHEHLERTYSLVRKLLEEQHSRPGDKEA